MRMTLALGATLCAALAWCDPGLAQSPTKLDQIACIENGLTSSQQRAIGRQMADRTFSRDEQDPALFTYTRMIAQCALVLGATEDERRLAGLAVRGRLGAEALLARHTGSTVSPEALFRAMRALDSSQRLAFADFRRDRAAVDRLEDELVRRGVDSQRMVETLMTAETFDDFLNLLSFSADYVEAVTSLGR